MILVKELISWEETNELLKNDVSFLRGVAQVQERQIKHLNSQITDMKRRSMKNNITIAGLEGDVQEENCQENVLDFVKSKLKMEVSKADIQVAH